MGHQKIKKWIEESLKEHPKYINLSHEEVMSGIYDVLKREYEEPVKMELLGISRTYKLTFADGRIEKIVGDSDTRIEIQKILYDAGVKVPKIVKTIPWNTSGITILKLQEWIDGECLRQAIFEEVILKSIDLKYWYKLGALLGEITTYRWEVYPLTVCDIHWSNFVLKYDKEEVWLIDCKKLLPHPFPEQWIYEFIIFSQHHEEKHIKAFTDGYLSIIRKPDEIRDRIIKHADIFTKGLYEKLA